MLVTADLICLFHIRRLKNKPLSHLLNKNTVKVKADYGNKWAGYGNK